MERNLERVGLVGAFGEVPGAADEVIVSVEIIGFDLDSEVAGEINAESRLALNFQLFDLAAGIDSALVEFVNPPQVSGVTFGGSLNILPDEVRVLALEDDFDVLAGEVRIAESVTNVANI